MGKPAITISGLGKQYLLGQAALGSQTFSETLTRALTAPLSWARQLTAKPDPSRIFWALRDIDLTVTPGEAVGIIGRNGAGKSTLLKILARITRPTEGRAEIRGRVGSLLEVGTGFHPDLTGRENIHLSGAILGMRAHEIRSKFDEIVEFAEIGRFVDTPVKRYSSGMYVRLAFAVAAHLETEVLFVDEVLAVGDRAFQEKCLNRMNNIASQGRTVLFVSHNMGSVNQLCDRAVWLDAGRVRKDGPAGEVVASYLSRGGSESASVTWAPEERPHNAAFELVSAGIRDSEGNQASKIHISEPFELTFTGRILAGGARPTLSLNVMDEAGNHVFASLSNAEGNAWHDRPMNAGDVFTAACRLPGNLLNEGHFHVSLFCWNHPWMDPFWAHHFITFEAVEDYVLKRDYPGGYPGPFRPKLEWRMSPGAEAD